MNFSMSIYFFNVLTTKRRHAAGKGKYISQFRIELTQGGRKGGSKHVTSPSYFQPRNLGMKRKQGNPAYLARGDHSGLQLVLPQQIETALIDRRVPFIMPSNQSTAQQIVYDSFFSHNITWIGTRELEMVRQMYDYQKDEEKQYSFIKNYTFTRIIIVIIIHVFQHGRSTVISTLFRCYSRLQIGLENN